MDPAPTPFPLPVIRDEPLRPRARRPVLAVLLHAVRLSIFAAILLLVRQQHQRFLAHQAARVRQPVSLDILRNIFPQAVEGGVFDPQRRTQQIVDSSGELLGFVVQTSPEADHIVGFSGPTNVLIAFGVDDHVAGVKLLGSRDTREHVDLIVKQGTFLNTWNGHSWTDVAELTSIDAVSGATLTSLAIAESIATRLGGTIPSLRFPREIDVSEVVSFFPEATSLSSDPRRPALFHVLADNRSFLGYVFRTSPAADNLVGYQGPTDTLIALDTKERILGIRLRHSFDNEPYVGYVEAEDYFLTLFNDRSLTDLTRLDPIGAGVEGGFGATMTSMAVADSLAHAARHAATEVKSSLPAQTTVIPNSRQLSTIAMVLLGLVIGCTKLRKFHLLRVAFLTGVIGIIGLLNGDMLSQAVLVGWAQNGVPWSIATGLVVISAVALLVPVVSKHQVYCHQLCPHGAVQQLVRQRSSRQRTLPNWLRRCLPLLPYGLLAWCVIVGMLHLPFSLVALEPFDAWMFQAAGTATIIVAVLGLGASLFVPMAYCRYGCPTGAVLGFLRFNSKSDLWNPNDWLATGLLALASSLSLAAPSGTLPEFDSAAAHQLLSEWFDQHHGLLWWLTIISGVFFAGSLAAIPWLVSRIPADYFTRDSTGHTEFRDRHPVIVTGVRILKNAGGSLLLLMGVAMLVLPGQGLLTMLLGIMLLELPGKRRLEIFIIRRQSINRAINWMRRRSGRDPLLLPDKSAASASTQPE
ncbi:MAG: FMN-binding protein [Planctomycetota bacterium]|nr:FMN-binding protein [Planctomycetota bacterium]